MPDPDLAAFRPITHLGRRGQITQYLRQQVVSGTLAAGSRLPSTQVLAKLWGAPVATVHAAMTPLVKEGLLIRRPRVGTIVQQPVELSHVATYRSSLADSDGRECFARILTTAVANRLAAEGVVSTAFIDVREPTSATIPSPALRHAIVNRQVEAVIATEVDPTAVSWLHGRTVPVALCGSDEQTCDVWYDPLQFARAGLARLAAQGCRSVGLIACLAGNPAFAGNDLRAGFVAGLAAAGLTARGDWLHVATAGAIVTEAEAERFGYDRVRALMAAGERPDGLLVFTDAVARGMLLGLLPFQADGSPAPRLVLHRNPGIPLFCPLPASFLELPIDAVAAALISCLRRKRLGQQAPFQRVPFTLSDAPEPAAHAG